MFKNSDVNLFKYIKVMKIIIKIVAFLIGILGIAIFIIGIKMSSNNLDGTTAIIEGIILIIFAFISPFIMFVMLDFITMLSYDLKTIRNKLYDVDNKDLDNKLGYATYENKQKKTYTLTSEQMEQLSALLKEQNKNDNQ